MSLGGQMAVDRGLRGPRGEKASRAAEASKRAVRSLTGLRFAAVGVTFALPLIVLPGLEQPFSTPKIVLLAAGVALLSLWAAAQGLLRWPDLPAPFQFALLAWLAALGMALAFGERASLRDSALQLAPIGWFLLLLLLRPQREYLVSALSLSAGTVAGLALLQYSGEDPFAWFGWAAFEHGSPRMRMFATLGNPNFTAAFLAGVLPLTAAARNIFPKLRTWFAFLLALQVAALFATGSRAAALGLAAALLWLGMLGRLRAWWKLVLLAALVALALLTLAPARPLSTTVLGRLYVWQVAAPHVVERPLLGFGLGTFAQEYDRWEVAHWNSGRTSVDSRKFAGPQDHAHNDYLETTLELGAVGLGGLLALLCCFLRLTWRHRKASGNDLVTGASAGVVGLLAIALVDFPFHRPTELFVFWTLQAIVLLHISPGHCRLSSRADLDALTERKGGRA